METRSRQNMTVDEVMKLAMQYHSRGVLTDAGYLYREVLKKKPDNHKALHGLGQICLQSGEYDEAIRFIRESLCYHERNAVACCDLAHALYNTGQTDEAIACYQKAIEFDPGLAIAYHNLGLIYKAKGQETLAESCIDKATKIRGEENNYPPPFMNNIYKEIFLEKGEPARKNEEQDNRDKPLISLIRNVYFELSNICNYSAVHKKCPLHGQTEKIVLSADVILKTIDTLAEIDYAGMFAFHLYNEPLIDPRLFQFIGYAKKMCPKSRIYLLTNGFYLNQVLVDELSAFDIWKIVVSAYSRREYDRLASLDVPVPYYVFYAVLDERLKILEWEPPALKVPCYSPIHDLAVNSRGDVVLCCIDWMGHHRFGNLYEESVHDVLDRKDAMKEISSLREGKRCLDLCRRCNYI